MSFYHWKQFDFFQHIFAVLFETPYHQFDDAGGVNAHVGIVHESELLVERAGRCKEEQTDYQLDGQTGATYHVALVVLWFPGQGLFAYRTDELACRNKQ